MTTQRNPYIGPRTYQREEGHLFFGREREARDLISLVASERLVVFYAQSGAGKSSIVNTRLIPNLEAKEYEVLSVGRVSGDTAEGLKVNNIYLYNLLRSLEQHEIDPAVLARLTLTQFLCKLNYDDKGFFYDASLPDSVSLADDETIIRRALIIDQFEELFSTHPEAWEKREDFFVQLEQAMQDDPHLWVVLVMREDYIAALDPYAHLVMNGLRVRYYMQRLGREAGLKAVKSPVEGIRPYAAGVAEKLIDDLCSIKVQQPDGTLDVQPGQYVEPVQMQVVCYGLWDNLSPDGAEITEKDLQDVGDVDQSLGKYYDRRVSEVAKTKNVKERLIREWFEKKLITAGGIRNMVLQERDPKPGELGDEVIQALQSDLVRAEKRGGGTWYELTHDRLVEPILERNKIWFNDNLSPLQRQAALWKDQEQNESWLLRDQALVEVEQWASDHQEEVTETEKEFLEACKKLQTRIDERQAAELNRLEMANKLAAEQARSARRSRIFSIVAGVLVVIALLTTAISFSKAAEAEVQRSNADFKAMEAELAKNDANNQKNKARSSELSTIALNRVDSEIELAILLGLQANSIPSDANTQNTLLALQQKAGRFKPIGVDGEDIEMVRYNPNGGMFAALDKNGINLWEANGTEQLNDEPLNGHFSAVYALAISSDEKYIASGASNGTIIIWDVEKQTPLCSPFPAHSGIISALAFSIDGKTLASASSSENDINIWDLNLSDPCSARKLNTLEGHSQPVLTLVFSPDGKLLASGGYDLKVRLWNPLTWKPYLDDPLDGQSNVINDLAFNSESNVLVAAGNDNSIFLWDLQDPGSPELASEISNDSYVSVQRIAISKDDSKLASANHDGSFTLWNVRDPEDPQKISVPSFPSGYSITYLSFLSDESTLVTSNSAGAISIWDIEDPEGPQNISESKNASNYGAFAGVADAVYINKSKTLIVGSSNSSIVYWDLKNLRNPQKGSRVLQGHPGRPTSMYFSMDGHLLVSSGEDGSVIFDVETQQKIGAGVLYENPGGDILAYQIFDPATEQNHLYLMNSLTGDAIGNRIVGENPIFSPDGNKIIFQTQDQNQNRSMFHLLDIKKNKKIDFPVLEGIPTFSRNSQYLAYQTRIEDTDGSRLTLWDIDAAKRLIEIPGATFLTFSADSRVFAYQTYDASQPFIHLLDISSLESLIPEVQGVFTAISPDGQTLWYQTYNTEKAEYWINRLDISSSVEPKIVMGSNPVVSPDGRYLLYISSTPGASSLIHLMDLTRGEEPVSTFEGQTIDGFFANGQVFMFRTSTPAGVSSIHVRQTASGEILFTAENTYLLSTNESNEVIAFQFYNYNNGENNLLLINTSNGEKIGGPLKGSFLKMDPNGKFLVYQAVEPEVSGINVLDLSNNTRIGEPISGTYMDVDWVGKVLITKNSANAISRWDMTKTWPFGSLVENSPEHISTAAMSPDGQTLAWVHEKGLMLQNTLDSALLGEPINNHMGGIGSISTSLSPNGELIAITRQTDQGYNTTLMEISTGRQIGQTIEGSALAIFSPDSRVLLTSDTDSETTNIWDISDATEIKLLQASIPGFLSAFSPDGNTLAISGGITNSSSTIRVWDRTSNTLVNDSIEGEYATFSHDGKLMAVSDSTSQEIKFWTADTLEPTGENIAGSFNFMCFSPNGDLLAVADSDNSIALWDLNTLEPISTSTPIPGIFPIGFSQDGRYLIILEQESDKITTIVWDVTLNEQVGDTFSGGDANSFIPGIPFAGSSPDDKVYAFLNDEKTITLWDRETDTKRQPPNYPGELLGINLNQRGPFFLQNNTSMLGVNILAMYGDKGLLLWDLEKDQAIGDLIPFENSYIPATAIMLSPNGRLVASLAEDGIVLRNLDDNVDTKMEDSTTLSSNMAFNMESTKLMGIGDGNLLYIWDVNTGERTIAEQQPLEGLSTILTTLFSPRGNFLAYESSDATGVHLHIWDLSTSKPKLEEPIRLSNFGGTIAFNSDETLMAYNDGSKVILFNTKENEFMDELLTGVSGVSSLKLIMDDDKLRYLITADSTGSTQLWDWETRTKIGDPILGNLQIIGIDDQNRRVYYIDPSGKLVQMDWAQTHAEWVEQLCPLAQRNFTQAEWDLYFPGEDYPTVLTCPEYPPGQ